ncbi:MAG: hypothetical protein WCX13_01635 [Candidatus Hydrogenedentales bacterium]
MKLGILFGPGSGDGGSIRGEKLLAQRLEGQSVAVCEGLFGGSGRPGDSGGSKDSRGSGTPALWERLAVASSGSPSGYVEELRAAVAALSAWGAELLVCVGGDGLASYAADAMLAGLRPMPLLGVAAGTINVGPIVTLGLDGIADLDPEKLRTEKVGAVEVSVDGVHLAYGFNDIVIGDTFLGMVDGAAKSLSVRTMLESGRKREASPSPDIVGSAFAVRKNGAGIDSGMRRPAQIIVSPLGKREFFARAIAGILCDAAYMKGAAAVALFDSVIVRAGSPERGIFDFSATEQLLFGPGDCVEISGLAAAGQIVVDGNPFARSGDRVRFRSIPDLVDVARLHHFGMEA